MPKKISRKMTKIINLIPKGLLDKWDNSFYKIYPPASLNSYPTVVIDFFNHNGSTISVAFDLHEGVEIGKDELKGLKKISKKRLKKIEKLAYDIVDDMDMDTLIEYARDRMAEYFSSLNKKEFDEEWDNYHDVFDKEWDNVKED